MMNFKTLVATAAFGLSLMSAPAFGEGVVFQHTAKGGMENPNLTLIFTLNPNQPCDPQNMPPKYKALSNNASGGMVTAKNGEKNESSDVCWVVNGDYVVIVHNKTTAWKYAKHKFERVEVNDS